MTTVALCMSAGEPIIRAATPGLHRFGRRGRPLFSALATSALQAFPQAIEVSAAGSRSPPSTRCKRCRSVGIWSRLLMVSAEIPVKNAAHGRMRTPQARRGLDVPKVWRPQGWTGPLSKRRAAGQRHAFDSHGRGVESATGAADYRPASPLRKSWMAPRRRRDRRKRPPSIRSIRGFGRLR